MPERQGSTLGILRADREHGGAVERLFLLGMYIELTEAHVQERRGRAGALHAGGAAQGQGAAGGCPEY